MSYPVIQRREDDGSAPPGRMLSFLLPALFFVLGLAMITVTFNVGDWAPWVFAGGIVSIAIAFAIPTAILPALEDR